MPERVNKTFFYTCWICWSFYYSKKFIIKCLILLYQVLNLISLRLYFVWIYLFWNNYSFGNECTQNTCHVDSKFWRFGCLELKVPQNPPHSSRYKCTLISHLSNSLIFGIYQCKIFFLKNTFLFPTVYICFRGVAVITSA